MYIEMKLLLFFDRRRILIDMKNACGVYLSQLNEESIIKFPPLRYFLHIDVMNLFNEFPELGDYLIKEPLQWQRHCNDILFACLNTLNNELIKHIQYSQVAVNIRLKAYPHYLTNRKTRRYAGFDSLYGLLVNVSKPKNYVFHSVWSCPEECEGNEVILQYTPKTSPTCYKCKSKLFENSGLRHCGEEVLASFKIKTNLLPKRYTIIDDLIPNLKIGSNYFVSSVVLKTMKTVWCLEEIVSIPVPTITLNPPSLMENDEKPWTTLYCLSSKIGTHICPSNCFISVKTYMLLSLASIKSNSLCGSPILHFLATGYDTGYISDLMRHVSLLAKSHVSLGPSNCLSSTLIAASEGICLLSLPLQVYSQKQLHNILSVIETGEMQDAKKAKLKCAVWAHGVDFKKLTIYDIATVFGSICRTDFELYTDELVDFILQKAVDPQSISNEEIRVLKDLSLYIDLIGGIKVSIDGDTQDLLTRYFLAARKERTKAITAGSMGSLVNICAISARFCRRSVANTDDAVFAIFLHVCGMSDPRIAPDEYLQLPTDLNKLNKNMEQFVNWLNQFTGNDNVD